jgi:predicted CoA-substrate-specific enzyme activase
MVEQALGVDSGSTTTKLVVLGESAIAGYYVVPTGANNRKAFSRVMELGLGEAAQGEPGARRIVATGYGRRNIEGAARQVSEITCQAKAIHWLFPEAQLVIDIGGQDFKAIELDPEGRVLNFAMNDKCAAGTGRYLELMAKVFELSLDDFGNAAASAKEAVDINSTCTVFAESEVVSFVSRGTDEAAIVAGVFQAVARRVYSLAKQFLAGKRELVFTGGVAKSAGMVQALERVTGCVVRVPEQPQITGALGAALFARDDAA